MKKLLALLLALSLICCGLALAEEPAAEEESQVGKSLSECSVPRMPAARLESVRVGTLKGPTTIGLVELMDRAAKGETELPYEFTMDTADAFITKMASGEIDIVTIPANAAAIWYNKLEGAVKVVDINTLGVLYIVAAADGVTSMADLAGKTLALTGKGTSPEWVLRAVLAANGIAEGDVTLEYKSEATEVMQALVSGAADLALLPQPFVTAACAQNENLRVVLDMTEEWTKAMPDSQLCTGVTVVRTAFLEEHPTVVDAFLADHAQSAAFANEHTAEAAELVAAAGIIEKAPVAEKAIPKCNIVCLSGEEMKAALSGYLQALCDLEPSAVGGKLPDEAFYYVG